MSFSTDEDKVSYGLGFNAGRQLLGNPFPGLNVKAAVEGVADALAKQDLQVPEDELQQAFAVINEKMNAAAEQAGSANKEAGDAFLAENAKRDGVTVLDSGLQYEVITSGDGATPAATSIVSTHYHGTLIDGTVFDSSVERGQPAEFPVNGVIKGWTEALQLMNVGTKWKLFVPPELAYGSQGAGGDIGPNCTLVFEVELLAVK